jgi:hypothetical protein
MDKTKFTARVDRDAFETAKKYAGNHSTTVTSLVEEFFRSLGKVDKIFQDTPILNELAGSLRIDTPLEDYHTYLEKKYLDDADKIS